jgi:hypothetical protein
MTSPLPFSLICSVCHKPIHLETSKTDERGDAVHEECYVQDLLASLHDPPSPEHAE